MARCRIEVALLERQRGSVEPAEYAPGAPMNVRVTVETDEPATCEGIEVVCSLEGRGKGFSPELEGWRVPLFEGVVQLPPGTRTYERRVAAPAFPPTWAGSWIAWDWWVQARIALPWATDPSDRERFVLRAAAPAGIEIDLPVPEGPETLAAVRESRRREDRKLRAGAAVAGMLSVALFAVGWALRTHWQQPEDVFGPLFGFAGLAVLVFVALVGAPVAGKLLDRLMKPDAAPIDVAVSLRRSAPSPDYRSADAGDALACTVFTDPKVSIDWMKARLEVAEWTEWTESSGDSRRTRSYKSTVVQRVADMTPAGSPGEWHCQLPMFDEPVPLTVVDAGGHGLVWQVEIQLAHGGKKPSEPIVRRFAARRRAT